MVTLVSTMTLWVAVGSTSGIFFNRDPNNHVVPPSSGVGFRNGNPDGYGWYEFGHNLPIGGDRIPDFYFHRYNAVPASQLFFPSYYNPYISRGQRFLPYAGCGGGVHPMSSPPIASAEEHVHPYGETLNPSNTPQTVPPPTFSGRVEANPVNPGSTGLRP